MKNSEKIIQDYLKKSLNYYSFLIIMCIFIYFIYFKIILKLYMISLVI